MSAENAIADGMIGHWRPVECWQSCCSPFSSTTPVAVIEGQMTDAEANTGPRGSDWKRRRAHRPLSLEGLPSEEELAQHATRHKGEAADRYSLYTPDQLEKETRPGRLGMTFGEPLKIRNQAEMIRECMDIIIRMTRDRDLGSTRLRIEARREFQSLGERLSILNDKTPYGFAKKNKKV